jgi:transposase
MMQQPISAEAIKNNMQNASDKLEYRRWQIIHLKENQKKKPKEIADLLGTSHVTVYNTINRLNEFGPEGMKTKPTGGRMWAHTTLEEEKKLLDEFLESARLGLIITVQVIQKRAQEKLGKPVSIFYVYDLLHRHGWSKQTPRPKHPKSNPKIQEEFKKKFHPWSNKP